MRKVISEIYYNRFLLWLLIGYQVDNQMWKFVALMFAIYSIWKAYSIGSGDRR